MHVDTNDVSRPRQYEIPHSRFESECAPRRYRKVRVPKHLLKERKFLFIFDDNCNFELYTPKKKFLIHDVLHGPADAHRVADARENGVDGY